MPVECSDDNCYIKNLNKFNYKKEIQDNILAKYKTSLKNIDKVYIFGAKCLGEKVKQFCDEAGIEVLGFIDNNKNLQGEKNLDIMIYSPQDLHLNKEIAIIVASTSYSYEIITQLKSLNYKNIIPYYILSIYDSEKFPEEPVFKGMLDDLIDNKTKYIELSNIFEEKKSKEVLNKIMNFRLTFDENYLNEAYILSEGTEYFDNNIVKLSDKEIFVDGGGFNGDTIKSFIKATDNQYKKILFFEPDIKSYDEAFSIYGTEPRINFYKEGLYSDDKTLSFSCTGRLGSKICEEGTTKIKVTSLDKKIKDKITFIKFDLEGSEEEAIKGGINHIKNDKPTLVICAYHKAFDLWKIHNQIKEINPDYKFYLRHYSKNCFDTVLYATLG